MITDKFTDTVFFSDMLPTWCPKLYQSIDHNLKEHHIGYKLLANTRDIWYRDYMPIQTDERRFIFYKYNPDYLQTNFYKRSITDVSKIGNIECLKRDAEIVDLDLVIDGGNVVKCDDIIVMTEKVFFENKDKSRDEVQRMLEDAFRCDVIILPWDRKEIFGHSDGIIHYVGNDRMLITNYEDFSPYYFRRFRKTLGEHFEVIPLKYEMRRNHKRSWAYINFLQVGQLVLVPQLGIPEDEQAIEQISRVLPECEVVGIPSLEAVRKGGALNCISWSIKK